MSTFPSIQGSMYRQAGYLRDIENSVDLYTRQLATGKKVTEPGDDPVLWLKIENLDDELTNIESTQSELNNTNISMSIAFSVIDGVAGNIESLESLLTNIKMETDPTLRSNLIQAYNTQKEQIDNFLLTSDETTNDLLAGNDVEITTTGTNKTTLSSIDLRTSTLGLDNISDDVTSDELDTIMDKLGDAQNTVKNGAMTMSTNQYITTSSSAFNEKMIGVYDEEIAQLNSIDFAQVSVELSQAQLQFQLVINNISTMDDMLKYLIQTLGQ